MSCNDPPLPLYVSDVLKWSTTSIVRISVLQWSASSSVRIWYLYLCSIIVIRTYSF
jgi:hypothetical protein